MLRVSSTSPFARTPHGATRASVLALFAVASTLPACLGSLPRPPSGPTPQDALTEVPYPPPPARVETVAVRPKGNEVWIDGQWDWVGNKWQWLEGTWMTPPATGYFTSWTTERRNDGRLFFARATWRDPQGRPVDAGYGQASCPIAPHRAQTGQTAQVTP